MGKLDVETILHGPRDDGPQRKFVIFLKLKNEPDQIVEKFVEADRFEFNDKRGRLEFYVGPNCDGAWKLQHIVGVAEVIVEDEETP